MAELNPTPDTLILRAPVSGELEAVPASEADAIAAERGLEYATAEQIEQYNLGERRGSAGQVALGLAETFARNATLGAVKTLSGDEDAARERAQYVGREHPAADFAAGVAPGVAASVATAGAAAPLGIAGVAAAEGVIGGLSAVGGAADEAFRHDQELSAEAALGTFGSGFLLGGAVGGVGAKVGQSLGGARNRFLEASGKVARQADGEAFAAAGVVRPVKGLSEALEDPVKAAALRKAGQQARPKVQQQFTDDLAALDTAEQAARQFEPTVAAAGDEIGDVSRQRAAMRDVLDSARKDLEPIASPEERGIIARSFENLDRAATVDDIYAVARRARAALDEALDSSSSPQVAKALKQHVEAVREIEHNSALFGSAGDESAARHQALKELADAREQLLASFNEGDYFSKVGTQAGAGADTALDSYLERLGAVLKSSDAPNAKEGLGAIARLQKLRDGDLTKVAGANQADAMRQFAPKTPEPSPMRDVLGEVAETAAELIVPGVGLARKAWKYRKHIARLAGMARGDAGAAASRMLGTAVGVAGKGGKALSRAAVPLAARAPLFSDVSGTPEEQYERVREVVTTLSNEPDRLAEALAEQLGDLPAEAPELLEALAAKAQRGVDFLKSKLPPAFEFSLLYPDGPPPSRMDIVEMGLYWRGVWHPREVLAAISDGSAMPEEVEAFRFMNPTWFTELQEALHERIVEKNQAGQVVSAFRLAQLEVTLDLPGKLDPTFSDGVAQIAQTAMATQARAQKQATYIPAPKAGQRVQPESLERIKS